MMSYNCIEEASELALEMIDNLLERRAEMASNPMQPLYMPHSHVLNLLQLLEEDKKENSHLGQLQLKIRQRLRSFEDMTRLESENIVKSMIAQR